MFAVESGERSESLEDGSVGMRVFLAGQTRPAQLARVFLRSLLIVISVAPAGVATGRVDRKRLNDDNKRHSIEIQVTHVGPDLQFATADVTKSTAEGSPAPAAAAG